MVVHAKRLMTCLIALVLMSVLALPAINHAQAQAPSELVINYPELTDTGDALQLGLYFTITDSTGRVVPNARVQSARIQLDDGQRDDNALVEQPTTPFFITLVLDASGSMGGAAEDMRQAAIQAINDAPSEARFAVIRFNEQIELLQDFTEDRNRAINAIGEVQPVNRSGTCLYDAAYQAIEMMSNAPAGRRAIILFTDGKDEVITGDPCSRHVFNDVIDLANQRGSRVPIHTIGLSTQQQNINVSELRGLASQTGGVSAIGEQNTLNSLFQQIMDALKSQWLAQSTFYPMQGTHTATLTVMLEGGAVLSAVTTFEVLRDFPPPITASPTATPVLVNITINSVLSDVPNELVELEVLVQGEQVISRYRFDFFDASTNQLLNRYELNTPLIPPVRIPAESLDGRIRVELRAFGPNGQLITWPDGQNRVVDKALYEFTVLRPTPTPLPPTYTIIPVTVDLSPPAYDQAMDIISLDLSFTGQEQISELEINVVDASTGLRVNVYYSEPSNSIQLTGQGLTPEQQYRIYVNAKDAAGQNLTRSKEVPFVYLPLLTPTPAPTETPTATPTESPVQVAIGGINLDKVKDELVITVLTEDQERIQSFDLQLRDSQSGLVVGNYVHTPPPYEELRIPLADIGPGEYTAILRALGEGGAIVAEADSVTFEYRPPPEPTVTPTLTPSPTVTPTPEPPLFERVKEKVQDNPALALVVALIGFALILILIVLFRPRKKQQTGTDFLSAQTGYYDMSSPGGAGAPGPGAIYDDEATNVGGMEMDPEKTDVFPGALPPLATLRFVQYPDASLIGYAEPITEFPFTIGRGRSVNNHLSLDADTSVSRRHATIMYENGQFMITDEGSSNGTALDGNRLMPNTPTALHEGDRIMLGKGTVLNFSMTSHPASENTMPGDDDEDRTDYINFRNSDG